MSSSSSVAARLTRSRSLSLMSSSLSETTSSGADDAADEADDRLDAMDALVRHAGVLSDALACLHDLLDEWVGKVTLRAPDEPPLCVRLHDALGRVSRALKELLRYDLLRTADVFTPASNLVHTVKALKLDTPAADGAAKPAIVAIRRLETAVADRLRSYLVGDYMTWEMSQFCSTDSQLSQSSEELSSMAAYRTTPSSASSTAAARSATARHSASLQRRHSAVQQRSPNSPVSSRQNDRECLSEEDMDHLMAKSRAGVDLAFGRSKAWSKYCKELLNFVQRRIALESEHAKSLQKLIESTRLAIQDEHYLPLKDAYLTSFVEESEFAQTCNESMKRLYEYKFVKPLESRRTEHDAARKDLKAAWDRSCKCVTDAAGELRKAKQAFSSRDSQYKKARETSLKAELSSTSSLAIGTTESNRAKIDKRRRAEEDAMLKREQSAAECKVAEDRLEEKYRDLERVKTKIIAELRQLNYQCDQTTKACTVAYFQALSGLWALLPMQYQNLVATSRAYVPGLEYRNFVKTVDADARQPRALSEEDIPQMLKQRRGGLVIPVDSTPNLLSRSPRYYDTDDDTSISSYSEVSLRPALQAARQDFNRAIATASCSEKALTHSLQKVRLPAKCCHCDSYTFFQTVQCADVMQTLIGSPATATNYLGCGPTNEPLDTLRMSIFGMDLQKHLTETGNDVPPILENCIDELDRRGIALKGLYRICGVKSKIEQICENFERCNANLTDVHPTNIASVVKLYLRQLPECLLSARLYPEFIQLAKDFPAEVSNSLMAQVFQTEAPIVLSSLNRILAKLPPANKATLKFLLLHLKRITWFFDENHMSSTNLGVVFGPTLLWTESMELSTMLEAPLQARAVELLIDYAYDLFDVDAEFEKKTYFEKMGNARDYAAGRDHKKLERTSTGDSPPAAILRPSNSEVCSQPEETNRNAATPDILRSHTVTARKTSEDGALRLTDSEDDFASCQLQFAPSPEPKKPPRSTSSKPPSVVVETIPPATTSSAAVENCAPAEPRFERTRPIRRNYNKQRSLTTTIHISPRSDDGSDDSPIKHAGSDRTLDRTAERTDDGGDLNLAAKRDRSASARDSESVDDISYV